MNKFKLNALTAELNSSTGIEHAVLQSVLNWSKAQVNDPLEINQSKQGWWANEFLSGIGCRDWTLARSKQTNDTLRRAKHYTEESLQWLITQNIATKITVDAGFTNERLVRIIKITLKDQSEKEITL